MMFRICLIILSLLSGFAAPCGAQNADEVKAALSDVTRQMANIASVQVDFVQEKKMAVFSAPVVLRGTMAWEKPDSFAWHVNAPIRYAIVMRAGTARQWDEENNSVQEFRMGANPVMRVASQQLQRWFGGDYKKLAEEYDVSLVGRKPLTMACVPHQGSPEAGVVARVLIQFRDDLRYIDRITIEEASGDTTTIRFEKTRLNETVPAEAWRVGP